MDQFRCGWGGRERDGAEEVRPDYGISSAHVAIFHAVFCVDHTIFSLNQRALRSHLPSHITARPRMRRLTTPSSSALHLIHSHTRNSTPRFRSLLESINLSGSSPLRPEMCLFSRRTAPSTSAVRMEHWPSAPARLWLRSSTRPARTRACSENQARHFLKPSSRASHPLRAAVQRGSRLSGTTLRLT